MTTLTFSKRRRMARSIARAHALGPVYGGGYDSRNAFSKRPRGVRRIWTHVLGKK